MNISDVSKTLDIHEVPDGGFIVFDVEGETHFGIKVAAGTLRNGPHIATLKHPDLGVPGLWVYGVATGNGFLHIPDAILRPKLAPSQIAVQWNRGLKAGMLVKTSEHLLLAIHTNRSHIGVINVQTGQYQDTVPSGVAFLISAWEILLPGPDDHQVLYNFYSP